MIKNVSRVTRAYAGSWPGAPLVFTVNRNSKHMDDMVGAPSVWIIRLSGFYLDVTLDTKKDPPFLEGPLLTGGSQYLII